jgi:hypothetical protein
VDRANVPDELINFDFANPDLPTGRRHETTVPQQALFLMNSPLVVEQAKKLVALSQFASCKDDTARIQFLYERIYQRPARPDEISLGIDFVTQTPDNVGQASRLPSQDPPSRFAQQFRRMDNSPPKKRAPLKPWEEYAHALLQANEMSFVN